ncbi:DUF3578 domain-containing protein [Streptomyces pactum]|uniref:DUF3578 domain-containing protein n=1 Tax=Streptomyces pactum TaxID=68249 RepID=B7TWN5_9ACTN|nr:DUF3578 domain-containing protein [Streptomyces pactum]ACJ24886.1 hypothetical protein [Streptomyces pactum]MBH5336252.1 DUF3578 domain-containing protein [Streptomyces pactum]
MGIRNLLLDVANTYDKSMGVKRGVFAQDRLRQVAEEWAPALPFGCEAEGYGGKGEGSATPWIGVYDPDVTRDPKEGLYLAYIYAADLSTVTLTLQQGVTSLEPTLGTGKRRQAYLWGRARAIAAGLPPAALNDWADVPDFKCDLPRPLSYEAGSVAARCYQTASLPDEDQLRSDLRAMVELLQRAALVAERLKPGEDGDGWDVPADVREYRGLDGFRPKNDSDYITHFPARTVRKKRIHERLISEFAPFVEKRGFVPITRDVHPKDLVIRKGGVEWLVEAKVVKRANPTLAVRQAVGQLLEYQHFLYRRAERGTPHLLGLFTEDIGRYADYLEELGMGSVWRIPEGWAGSPSAVAWGLVQ